MKTNQRPHIPWLRIRRQSVAVAVPAVLVGICAVAAASTDPSALRLAETLGPSSRRTPLVISEVMVAPAPRNDGRNLEFIELYNSQPWFQDLGGYRLTGAIDFTFPPGTQLASNAFIVVAKVPADLQAVHGITNLLGPYAENLPDDSGTIRLEH